MKILFFGFLTCYGTPTQKEKKPTPLLNGVCVFDHDEKRIFTGYFETSKNMTIQKCLSRCRSKGFQYAGLQWQTECYCGSEPETGFEWAWPDKCNEKCGGDSDQICGGSMAMSVYSVAKDGICIYDFPASRRVLDRFSVTGHVNMTIDLCRDICDSKSSRYYGLQNGDECHCGDNDSDFLPADQYQCNMPCSGNCDETCGGSWRMNVYKIKQEPTWTEWDDWECCSVACGNGTMSRYRKCLDEYGKEAKQCNGTSKETINCIQWTETCDESWKWDQWGEWNECSVTCGNGTASRVRTCYDWENNISNECDGIGVEVQNCAMPKCITGTPVVQETTEEIRETIELEDNLFVDRYAESVTMNGLQINAPNATEIGYGVWRLTRTDIERLIAYRIYSNISEFEMDITTDYYYNVALVCKDGIQFDDTTTVDDILPLLDTTPCLSVIALCTLLKIDGFYPVNPDFEAQKSLLEGLSTQILVDFEVVLEREQKRNMDECALADIDFEFVIDSSG